MQKIKLIVAGMIMSLGLVAMPGLAVMGGGIVYAADTDAKQQLCYGIVGCNATGTKTLPDIVKTIVNILLYILGAVAVIMIVIGGIRYTTSGGDSSAIKGAKDTILYSIIGLVVAFMAYAIVNWVIGKL